MKDYKILNIYDLNNSPMCYQSSHYHRFSLANPTLQSIQNHKKTIRKRSNHHHHLQPHKIYPIIISQNTTQRFSSLSNSPQL